MNTEEDQYHISPRYSLYVKGRKVKKDIFNKDKIAYGIKLILIIDDKVKNIWNAKSFFVKEEIGLIDIWEHSTSTLFTYHAINSALSMIESLNLKTENISLYISDPTVGRHLVKKAEGKKRSSISRLYDYFDIANKTIIRIAEFKNLSCFYIPPESNSMVDELISRSKINLLA